jgi:enamine deaminase RidA (YjgF/YER057c/UK114 family)
MSDKVRYSSGVIWEDIVGYSRAVKVNDRLLISGTTSIVDGKIIGEGDPYLQTKTIIDKLEIVLHQAESNLEDIVRLRVYVTDISKWEEVGRALGETFKKIKPAQTLVGVSALVDPKMMVEIEAEAVLS